MKYGKVIFVSGYASPEEIDKSIRELRRKGASLRIDVAANAYAGSFIKGLESHFGAPMELIGDSYARRAPGGGGTARRREPWSHAPGSDDAHVSVIEGNKAVNLATKAVSILAELLRRTLPGRKDVLVIAYSVHMPYILPAYLLKLAFPRVRICVIIPDLPEFMDAEIDKKPIKRFFKAIEGVVSKRLIARFDFAVLIAEAMGGWIGQSRQKRVVVEGLIEGGREAFAGRASRANAVLYTGTLDERFGIMDLLEAYMSFESPGYELWICGFGDCAARVEEASKRNPGIRYFGIVTRGAAREMQRKAKLLVNPRSPGGSYTRYSFPSKTLEYLVSGTPVLMRRLPGVPARYYDYVHAEDEDSVGNLAARIDALMARDDEAIESDGRRGMEFAAREKNPVAATKPIFDMLMNP